MSTTIRNQPLKRREERRVHPQRFGNELERTFNPDSVRAQFELLIRPFTF